MSKSNKIKDLTLKSQSVSSPAKSPEEARAQAEARFYEIMQEPLRRAQEIGAADIVIGVPFYNEAITLPKVLEIAERGLAQFFPDAKSVLVAAGSPVGESALKAIGEMPLCKKDSIERIAFLLDDDLLNGKGWSTRAIIEITDKLGADLVLLEADLQSRKKGSDIEGFAPDWISLLLDPIRTDLMDMVVSKFNLHYLDLLTSADFKYPLLGAIYRCPIHGTIGGLRGISYDLVHTYTTTARRSWHNGIGGYGIDTWLPTEAITSGARICEANLGIKIRTISGGKSELVSRQVAKTLIERIVKDRKWHEQSGLIRNSPLLKPLPVFGVIKTHQPDAVGIVPQLLIDKYREGFNRFHSLYERIFPRDVCDQLEKLVESDTSEFDFPVPLWTQIVYDFLLTYAFGEEFAHDDLFDALVPLHDGFIGSKVLQIQSLKESLNSSIPEGVERLVSIEAEKQIEELAGEFLRQKPIFLEQWETEAEALKPPVPHITYREFIPGVRLIVPTVLVTSTGNRVVDANGIYNSVFARQKEDFEHFVYEYLGVPRQADSDQVISNIKDFMRTAEDAILSGFDFSTVDGTKAAVKEIFDYFPHEEAFSLTDEMATWLLDRNPPIALLTKLGFPNQDRLLEEYDACDVLALASWVEEREYIEDLWSLINRNIRTEHFAPCPVKPLVVSDQDFPALVEMRDSSSLDKLGSGIVVSNLHKGMGGEFPKLRYLTTIARNIVEAERFGQVWQQFAADRKDFGRKVIDSIEGHWGREPLSVHNIFEDSIQRIVADRLRAMGERIISEGNGSRNSGESLKAIADSYHLALTLHDGRFATCSAWSWAGYSFKGGKTSPPPLSAEVERDWTSREFLVRYYAAIGGTEQEVEEQTIELMGQGRAWEDLGSILLGTEKDAEKVVTGKTFALSPEQPLAGEIHRLPGNPILQPIRENPWESKYVLNAAAIWLRNKVYLVYRAFGDDKVSRLGLAVSEDGFNFSERLDSPIFEPTGKNDIKGCEDPRLIIMNDRIYMTYTAYDGIVAQIALASISMDDFCAHRWKKWHRHGMVFPGFINKDAALFPEQFGGKFAMLHRVDPHIWITFSSHLRCPWPRKEHEILAGVTFGLMWDGRKIGAGAQPIKTKYGWLLITHGVDYAHIYRLGLILLDLKDPSQLIYRSPNFVLEPEEKWELGKDEDSWVAHVVFTCGAVPRDSQKEILDSDDELIIYYGAADTVMCVGTANIGELIPEKFRT
ncbi:MAG: glycosidase [Chloroflexi bacterium]|nr:glycosidase [Chloroflexota bacterium]